MRSEEQNAVKGYAVAGVDVCVAVINFNYWQRPLKGGGEFLFTLQK